MIEQGAPSVEEMHKSLVSVGRNNGDNTGGLRVLNIGNPVSGRDLGLVGRWTMNWGLGGAFGVLGDSQLWAQGFKP